VKRRILLPTDFSKNAWHAIHYAKALYANDDCDFYVLNVFNAPIKMDFDPVMYMQPGDEYYERAKNRSEEGLTEILDTLMFDDNGNPNHHFKTISTYGQPLEAIKNVVEDEDIDLIVMGTKGETGSNKVIYGSVAMHVMEKVRNCPVIVVPEKAKVRIPKEIVFPTSYKTHFKRKELQVLLELAKNCGAKIAVLHVSEEDGLEPKQIEGQKRLTEYLEDVDFSFHKVTHAIVEPAVNIFVESRQSDMVAFINKKHRFFASILTKPMVKGITFHSKVPILVMHDLRN
jgi:nucleotide-binding universal stress UspA family protein